MSISRIVLNAQLTPDDLFHELHYEPYFLSIGILTIVQVTVLYITRYHISRTLPASSSAKLRSIDNG